MKNKKLIIIEVQKLIFIHLFETVFTQFRLFKANSSETIRIHEIPIPEQAKVIPK